MNGLPDADTDDDPTSNNPNLDIPDTPLPLLNLAAQPKQEKKQKPKKNCSRAGILTCCIFSFFLLPIACCVVCNSSKKPAGCKNGANVFGCEPW